MTARFSSFRHATITTGVTLIAMVALASPVAAAPSITFRFYMGGSCLAGFAPANADVHYTWRSSSGTVKQSGDALSDDMGYWYTCPIDEPSGDPRFEIGDRIRATADGARRTFTVPRLTLAIDRVAKLFVGTGPAGSVVDLVYYPGGGDTGESVDVPVGADGSWQYDPGDVNWPDVSARLDVQYRGDWMWIENIYTPELVVAVNTAQFSGYAGRWQEVNVSLVDAKTGTERGQGTAAADYYGRFAGVIRDDDGRRLKPRPGDRVVSHDVAPDAEFVLQQIAAQGDPQTEIVTGRCVPNDTFASEARVWVFRANGALSGTPHEGPTDADGSFTIDTSTGSGFIDSPSNIKRGSRVKVDCLQSTGDAVRFTFVAR